MIQLFCLFCHASRCDELYCTIRIGWLSLSIHITYLFHHVSHVNTMTVFGKKCGCQWNLYLVTTLFYFRISWLCHLWLWSCLIGFHQSYLLMFDQISNSIFRSMVHNMNQLITLLLPFFQVIITFSPVIFNSNFFSLTLVHMVTEIIFLWGVRCLFLVLSRFMCVCVCVCVCPVCIKVIGE